MNGAGNLTSDVDLDVAGLFAQIWRKKWLIVTVTIVVAAALFVALSLAAPRYKSSARILIEKRESIFTRRSESDPNLSNSQFDEQAIGSQVQVLTSDDIALRVIDKLNLVQAREFSGEGAPGLGARLKSMLPFSSQPPEISPQERILRAFRERLLVYAADKSRVLVVEFWAHDRNLAQSVPNALADEYLELTRLAKLESESQATGWLEPEIEDLRAKVRAAEAKVAEFRSNSDILVSNNNALLATQQLSEASTELSRLRADKSAAEAKVSAIRAALEGGGSLDAIPEVIASPLIQRLRERQVSLQAEISELETTLLPNHPKLKALKSQSGDFNVQIRNAAANILKSLENNVDLARKQEAVLLGEVERLKAEAARVGEAEVELRALEREANAQRELLESYLSRFREAASRQQGDYQPVDARIISRAIRPTEAYFPKVIPFTIAGAFVVMILCIVAILSWALLSGQALRPVVVVRRDIAAEPEFDVDERNDHDFEPEETEPLAPARVDIASSAPIRVEAPSLAAAPPKFDEPVVNNGSRFELFRSDDAIAAIRSMDRAIIAIVSPEGSSAMTAEIARDLAGSARVAVIDLSADGAATKALLGEGGRLGLADFANRRCEFAEAIHPDRESDLQVLPAGDPLDEGLPLALDRLREILAAMAETFDYLVIDCGDAGSEALDGLLPQTSVVLVDSLAIDSSQVARRISEFEDRGFRETIAIAA